MKNREPQIRRFAVKILLLVSIIGIISTLINAPDWQNFKQNAQVFFSFVAIFIISVIVIIYDYTEL